MSATRGQTELMKEARVMRHAIKEADRVSVQTDDPTVSARVIESSFRQLGIASVEVRLALLEYCIRGWRYGRERGIALRPSGEVIFYRKGEFNHIPIWSTDKQLLAGNVFCHNHPVPGSSVLSARDLVFAHEKEVAEVRATGFRKAHRVAFGARLSPGERVQLVRTYGVGAARLIGFFPLLRLVKLPLLRVAMRDVDAETSRVRISRRPLRAALAKERASQVELASKMQRASRASVEVEAS